MYKLSSCMIKDKISELKKQKPANFSTNYFFNVLSQEVICFDSNSAFIFLSLDKNIYRLYYCYTNIEEFSELLSQVPTDLNICVEHLTKTEISQNLFNIINHYFKYETTYERMRVNCQNLRQFKKYSHDDIEKAKTEEITYIFNVLNDTFNYYSSHFPDIEELKSLQNKGNIFVVRNEDNEIACFLIFKITGKSSNFDQLVSIDHNAMNTMKLLDYYNSFIKGNQLLDSYLWVDTVYNKPVVKMHKLFGYQFDGLKDYFFISDTLKKISK